MMSEENKAADGGNGKQEELEGEADMCRQRGNEYFGRRVRSVETGWNKSSLDVL